MSFDQHPVMRASTLLRVILGIQSVIVRGFHFEPAGLVVDVAPHGRRLPRCGECGKKSRRVKDRRKRRWRHLDIAGMKVHLQYAIRRVHCQSCHGVKTEQVEWAGPGRNFTRAFEERAAYLAQQCSKSVVSNFLRISWRTVGDIVQRVVQEKLGSVGDRLDGLKHIGIDELSYRKHHEYVTVVIDHERGAVVWSSKGKNADTLREFFDELGPERCAKIESVTIDMSKAYIAAVTESVPHARLIFDRFHVQRLLSDAMDETRRDEVRSARTKEAKKALKRTRWALLKSEWNLTDADHQTLAELEKSNATIFRGHMLKEWFVGILEGRQINVARRRMEEWIAEAKASGLDAFCRVSGTVERHLDGILEYVRTRSSNGRTEGLNGKIRTITRRAFGFHSATALISMIFLCCGGVHVTPAFSTPESFH